MSLVCMKQDDDQMVRFFFSDYESQIKHLVQDDLHRLWDKMISTVHQICFRLMPNAISGTLHGSTNLWFFSMAIQQNDYQRIRFLMWLLRSFSSMGVGIISAHCDEHIHPKLINNLRTESQRSCDPTSVLVLKFCHGVEGE